MKMRHCLSTFMALYFRKLWFYSSGRTYASMIFDPVWSHYGQQFWFGISDSSVTIRVKFQNFHSRRNISPRNFAPVVRKIYLHDFWPVLVALLQKFQFGTFDRGATRWVKFKNFPLGGSIFPRNFAPVVRKVSLHDFWLVLVALQPKIPIWYFWPWYDHKVRSVLSTLVGPFPYLKTFIQWCHQWQVLMSRVKLFNDHVDVIQ